MGCTFWQIEKSIDSDSDMFNGDLLTMAREARGLTLEELAKSTGIPANVLRQIERHGAIPTEVELLRLEMLDFPRAFFFRKTITGDFGIMFACGEGIKGCVVCGQMAGFLCDYPMGKGEICSAPICDHHAVYLSSPDVHLCPVHGALVHGDNIRKEERD